MTDPMHHVALAELSREMARQFREAGPDPRDTGDPPSPHGRSGAPSVLRRALGGGLVRIGRAIGGETSHPMQTAAGSCRG